jgi:hypothetical protein
VPHARRRDRVHQPRNRRTCLGELIQIDGCDHEWFEGRAERCTLLVSSTRRYLGSHGKPVAFYSDKASVFAAIARSLGVAMVSRNSGVP